MKHIVLAVAACLALSGCLGSGTPETTEAFKAQVAATCANIKPFFDSIQIIDDAGELSPNNHKKFASAKIVVGNVCTPGAVVNWQTAVTSAALTYVILVQINKDEKNG